MILTIDTSLLKKIDNLSLNQLILLHLVLNNNQKTIKDVTAIVSQVSNNEIQDLIERGYLTQNVTLKNVTLKETEKLINIVKGDEDYFNEFKILFPTIVYRPDGTKGFLHSNSKKCKDYYNKLIKNDYLKHQHIMDCLKKEIEDKTINGKMGFMKTMWKWLTNHEWENYEDNEETIVKEELYGTELI